MGKDPVCHEEVDERSAWTSSYQDRTYYFNSAECKADFDRDPGRYAAGYTGAAGDTGTRFQAEAGRTTSRARSKVQSMISEQKGKAAERIGSVSSAFRSVSQQLRDQDQAAIAQYADRAASSVDRFSGYLKEHDAEEIIHQAEQYVRQRPALVIGGALAAGFLVARFLKSSRTVSA
jgi:YHS domain-containing protein/ElaB/YqjD/DUF883 family membrane-anchored ribosome-binding protein